MAFSPRTTAPTKDNKWYFSNTNIFYASGYGMPNCTAYVFGRFSEILGSKAQLANCDAGGWFNRDAIKPAPPYIYNRGSQPQLGAVIVWSKPNAGGHVAVVEEIKSDGTIITSNSAYKGTNFYLREIKPPYAISGYKFEGFIYNPAVSEPIYTPGSNPTPDKYTLTRLLKKGCTGSDVKLLQSLIGTKADGIFGVNTLAAVKSFQKSKGLSVDGIVGKNTANALGWNYK